MEEIIEKFNKLESEITEMRTAMETLLINNQFQRKHLNKLRKENHHLKNRMKNMDIDFLQFTQYSRRENIEISNIPESIPQRDLEYHVIMVLQELGLEIYSYDLVGVHRIGKYYANKNRNVIVRFINRKNAYLALERNNILRQSIYNNYFINENMCPENRRIFNYCYKLKKNGDIQDVWFSEGIVTMIISDVDDPVGLLHISDIYYFIDEEISFDLLESSNSDSDD